MTEMWTKIHLRD